MKKNLKAYENLQKKFNEINGEKLQTIVGGASIGRRKRSGGLNLI